MVVLASMETSTTSSIITRLGAGSGIDMAQLALDLSEARFAVQTDRLNESTLELEAQIETATLLRNQISELASAMGERVRTGDLAPQANLANPAVATASILTGANPQGTFDLEVTQLASGQSLALNAFASGDELVGEGTLTLTFGTVSGTSFSANSEIEPAEITVEATDTLQTLAGKITGSGDGVTAYVANGINGAQLVIKGPEGAANGFTVSASTGGGAPGSLGYLAWDPASDSGQLREAAANAEFLLDTIAMTNDTNRITDLPAGLQLNLTSTNAGAPTTISFTDRSSGISDLMSDFVTALNEIATELNAASDPLGGVLGSDSGTRQLKREMTSLTSEIIMPNADDDEPQTLSDLGLSLNTDGTFRLDAERLARTLDESPDGAVAMFTTGLYGVFATLDDLARATSTIGDPGSLGGSIQRYNRELTENAERLSEIAEQQEALRQRLTISLGAADRQVAVSNSTLSFLQQQIEAWNASS
jgi:flagellar hook-associated protein 2